MLLLFMFWCHLKSKGRFLLNSMNAKLKLLFSNLSFIKEIFGHFLDNVTMSMGK